MCRKEAADMLKKGLCIMLALVLAAGSASAEIIRIGKTHCLLQPPSEEDGRKKYALFVGSAEYFHGCMLCGDVTAKDGELLIPQGNEKYILCSAASDVVIRDLWPTLRSWAEEGFDIVLIGYSAGGYPATVLASRLAEEGYTGRLYLLDGIYGAYRSVHYNEDYYREHLASWDLTICASTDDSVQISGRTRKVGAALAGDGNVVYRQYALDHTRMTVFYDVILNGAEAPEPVFTGGADENGEGQEETDRTGGDTDETDP